MLDASSQTCCSGSESNVRHSGGVPGSAPSGDFWSRIRLWKAVAEEITRNRCLPARGPVGGERTASCVPARGPVGGERTAFSMLPRRFRDSRRLEAWLKGRKRKMLPRRFRDSRRLEAKTGRARRCFTDFFYGFRKQR